MQLPSQLQHFPSPSLIVATDSVWAIFLLVHGESIEELERLHVPHEQKQDAEGERFSPGTGAAIGLMNENDDHQLHEFVHQTADRMKQLIAANNIERIYLVMPPEVEHRLTEALPHDLEEHIAQRLHLDLVQSTPIEIVERLLAD